MGRQNELLQKAFTAMEAESAGDSIIIGDSSSIETRTIFADAFFNTFSENKGHRRKKAKTPRGRRIR